MTDRISKPARVFADESHAPMVFFELVPSFGNNGGIITASLACGRAIATEDGKVDAAPIIVGYLKCSPAAAIQLRDAINKALLIGAPAESEAKN